MFKIFPFGFGGIFNSSDLNEIGGMFKSFLYNVNINQIMEQCEEILSNIDEDSYKDKTDEFIKLDQYDDMYLLRINLRGIDLRELSIRYEFGQINIKLNRVEAERTGITIFSSNTLVKRKYNKEFKGIEDIDMSRVMKNIDNGILSIRMPKKYVINSSSNIIDVDNYEVETKVLRRDVDK
ncbi:Hsp20/alpha crystallin family protein [Clostridium saccharobutylicum]|uniref:Hsp20/alpha crystallin family protein n=1 Tax=Clostridium saccharobutylicum TaxID=169679 RepID=A0A1S8NJU1_CLOSA|nr:Hsp20/alpha crystallin family protein [Clostridium saccharobutylicum]OOM16759.1 Hsp20/alpha crystallin family protein [Clostridium saccharobutylicum]